MNNFWFGICLAFALGGSFLIGREAGKREVAKTLNTILDKANNELQKYLKEHENVSETKEHKDPESLN